MKKHTRYFVIAALFLFSSVSCVTQDQQTQTPGAGASLADTKAALAAFTADDLSRHIKVLASDEYEGRAPGTRGEELTVNYLTEQFKSLGLKPGNPDGTYVQNVPMAGFTAETRLSFNVNGKVIDLKSTDDYVAVSRRIEPRLQLKFRRRFVATAWSGPNTGGILQSVDVRGKTIVMLITTPLLPTQRFVGPDDKMFKAKQ